MAKTEGSTCAYAKGRGGKELDRWLRGAGNGAQRSSEGGWECEKTEEEGMVRARPNNVEPHWIG